MEQMKTVDLSKVAFLNVRGMGGYPLVNQSFLVHFWKNVAEIASRQFHGFLNHLLTTVCRRMVVSQAFGTRELFVPLRLVIPGHFEAVAEQESQRTDDLPDLPFIDMGISPDVHQPLR